MKLVSTLIFALITLPSNTLVTASTVVSGAGSEGGNSTERRLEILPDSEVLVFEEAEWKGLVKKCSNEDYDLSGVAVMGHIGLLATPVNKEAKAAGCKSLGFHAIWMMTWLGFGSSLGRGPELFSFEDEGVVNHYIKDTKISYGQFPLADIARVYEEVDREGQLAQDYMEHSNDCATLVEIVIAKLGVVDENDEKMKFLAKSVVKTSPWMAYGQRVAVNGGGFTGRARFFTDYLFGTSQTDEEVADLMVKRRIEHHEKNARKN